MSLTLHASSEGLELVAEKLKRFDLETLKAGLAELVVTQTKDRIASDKRAPSGKAWQPSSGGGETLHDTGGLRDSITSSIGGYEIRVGSNLVYAAIHQFGGTIRPKRAKALAFTVGGRAVFAKQVTIPARPYLGFSAENMQEIREVAEDFMLKAVS